MRIHFLVAALSSCLVLPSQGFAHAPMPHGASSSTAPTLAARSIHVDLGRVSARPKSPSSSEGSGAEGAKWTDKALVLLTAVLAVAAAIQAIVTYYIAKFNNTMASEARTGSLTALEAAASAKLSAESAAANAKALVVLERAWLLEREFSLHDLPGKDASFWTLPHGEVKFCNSGRSPAWIQSFWSNLVFVNDMAELDASLLSTNIEGGQDHIATSTASAVLPNAEWSIFDIKPSGDFDMSIISAVEAGAKVLSILGSVSYFDAFGQRHRTNFCRVYSPHRKRFLVAGGGELNSHT